LFDVLQTVRVQANVSTGAESFQIPAAPDLIPNGAWKKVEGGVCAAKGFKATGASCVFLCIPIIDAL
jgi:glutamate N-acetyltransferase/amino-acid N-acetyltransferase